MDGARTRARDDGIRRGKFTSRARPSLNADSIFRCNTILIEARTPVRALELNSSGRVGRYSKAPGLRYLLTPPDTRLLDVARHASRRMRQHKQLGAGFRIAMAIRAALAPAISSARQSGQIGRVGFAALLPVAPPIVARHRATRPRGDFARA